MKRMIVNTVLFIAFFFNEVAVLSSETAPTVPDTIRTVAKEAAFVKGEKLEYRIHYGWIDAGEAVLEITKESKIIGKKRTLHM